VKHFIDIASHSSSDIQVMLERAQQFREGASSTCGAGETVAMIFCEDSTRTRVSFEMAAHNIGMRVIALDLSHSSLNKGETLEDTLLNLRAMGIRFFIIRHPENTAIHALAEQLSQQDIHLINAGAGMFAHPSQALLDAMTLVGHHKDLAHARVVLLGDIRHSRVAGSLQVMMQKLACGEFIMVAPPVWQPEKVLYGRVSDSLAQSLEGADALIALRVQKERICAEEQLDPERYCAEYQLDADSIRLGKKAMTLMHPGPVNWGVELDASLKTYPHNRILEQVENGVYCRMTILERLIQHSGHGHW